jgi:hypothetical protein
MPYISISITSVVGPVIIALAKMAYVAGMQIAMQPVNPYKGA